MLRHFWDNHDASHLSGNAIHHVNRQFKCELSKAFINFYNTEINRFLSINKTGGRYSLFSKLKKDFIFEEYLHIIKNPVHRQAYTQLRLSAHKLNIEVGRHHNVPRENRLCSSCNMGVIEDELHFVLHCTRYSSLRKSLFDSIVLDFPYFSQLTSFDQLIWLLTEVSIAPRVAKFIHESLECR